MTVVPNKIGAISLFVEDLRAARTFYQEVFGASVLFEDQNLVAFKFENLIVNLLQAQSAPEIIEPGLTGFLVDSDAEADAAVLQARTLDRANVRRRFELRFSAAAMARRYVDLFERMIPATGEPVAANSLDPAFALTA